MSCPLPAEEDAAEEEVFIDPAAVKAAIEAARAQLGLPAAGTEGDDRAAALKKPLRVKPGKLLLSHHETGWLSSCPGSALAQQLTCVACVQSGCGTRVW